MKKAYVVGIDIGGTNTAYGVVDARGNLLATESFSTCMHNDDIQAYVDELSNRINALISSLGLKQQVVGIGEEFPMAIISMAPSGLPSTCLGNRKFLWQLCSAKSSTYRLL